MVQLEQKEVIVVHLHLQQKEVIVVHLKQKEVTIKKYFLKAI